MSGGYVMLEARYEDDPVALALIDALRQLEERLDGSEMRLDQVLTHMNTLQQQEQQWIHAEKAYRASIAETSRKLSDAVAELDRLDPQRTRPSAFHGADGSWASREQPVSFGPSKRPEYSIPEISEKLQALYSRLGLSTLGELRMQMQLDPAKPAVEKVVGVVVDEL